jgi:parallel beta-helix repeat protein
MYNAIRLGVLVGALAGALSNVADADVINVPGDQLTIQAGIDAAVSGDVVLVAPGTYLETIDFDGKDITVRGSGGAAVTTIDASTLGTCAVKCDTQEGPETVLDGFTITGGTGCHLSSSGHGGGGMINFFSSPTVMNCTFIANTATGNGGGMNNFHGSPTVTNCTFIGNSGGYGGGMHNENASPTVTNCRFSGNSAVFDGGGMRNSSSSPIVENCTFSGNTAAFNGGGMGNNLTSNPIVTNCTFGGNTATIDGGGMANIFACDPVVTNSVFWMNSDADGTDESAQIYSDDQFDVSTPVVTYSDVQGGWTGAGGAGNIDVDPQFVDADGPDNLVGTEDDNLRLQEASPCIDAGTNAVGSEVTDLDSNPRVTKCSVDMGAFEHEAVGTPLVDNVTQGTSFFTIQEAVHAALSGDVIEAAPCRYSEIIDFSGKAITLQSTDPTDPAVVTATIIDASRVTAPGDRRSAVRCDSGEGPDTVLDGFTITGGTGDTAAFGPLRTEGGGMFIDNASPTVRNCTFTGNTAGLGGGGMLNKNGSSPTLTNCTFRGNAAVHPEGSGASGGGMYNLDSSPTLTNCTFTQNAATGDGAGMINTNSSPIVTSCTFTDNEGSTQGGGMAIHGGSPIVTDCTFIGNSARTGGGMWNSGASTVTNCKFNGNTASQQGGGVFQIGSSAPTFTNCTLSGNFAGDHGGGFANYDTQMTLINCTLHGNVAGKVGGAVYARDCSDPQATNCIFWGNSPNEFWEASACTTILVDFSDVQGGWAGNGNIDVDPLFVDADGPDNVVGTEDDNLRLQLGSTCIDTGTTTVVSEQTDKDGNPRITHCTVDMGAYEVQAEIALPLQNLTQGTSFCGIQEAIDAAVDGDVIEAAPRPYYEIIDFSGKAITLRGSEPTNPAVVAATVIDASLAANPGDGKPVVRCDNGEGPNTVLNGFTITGGTGDTSQFDASTPVGGGMYNNNTSPTVMNCTFSQNTADLGGGMYNIAGGNPTVTHCTFSENTAEDGGGMHNEENSSPMVTSCTFSGNIGDVGGGMSNVGNSNPTVMGCAFDENMADGGAGAGMYNDAASPTVTECTFSGNFAGTNGGGMHNTNLADTAVFNSTFSANIAANNGAGMYNDNASPIVTNCTFTLNAAGTDGGGMYNTNFADTEVLNCAFSANTAANSGGGMFNGSNASPTLLGCTFTENTANFNGGGLFNINNSLTVTSCTFSENFADSGGAMLNDNATVTVTNCMFSGNAAVHEGGGMRNFNSNPTLTTCAFSGNRAQGFDGAGGGIHNDRGSPVATNCTFSENTASFRGGGMFNQRGSNPTMRSCIFWGNSDATGNAQSGQIHNDNSIQMNNPVVNFSDIQGGWNGAGGTGNLNADPQFVDADGVDDVVGTLDDMLSLMAGSLCIDSGDPAFVALPGETDLGGHARVLCNRVDMGAYEFAGDFDCNQAVDLLDFASWDACMTGPDGGPHAGECAAFDFDGDLDIDLQDFTKLGIVFSP